MAQTNAERQGAWRARQKTVRAASADTDREPMSRDEYRRCLDAAVRSGSVQAMRLWMELHSQEELEDDDRFAELDELDVRRRR